MHQRSDFFFLLSAFCHLYYFGVTTKKQRKQRYFYAYHLKSKYEDWSLIFVLFQTLFDFQFLRKNDEEKNEQPQSKKLDPVMM